MGKQKLGSYSFYSFWFGVILSYRVALYSLIEFRIWELLYIHVNALAFKSYYFSQRRMRKSSASMAPCIRQFLCHGILLPFSPSKTLLEKGVFYFLFFFNLRIMKVAFAKCDNIHIFFFMLGLKSRIYKIQ